MSLYSYVVARDFGFAPNPFYGYCTLATCKPRIRRSASIGDWILGTGSACDDRDGHVVYAMRITGTLTYDQYWRDPEFRVKRPYLRGSKKQAFGDNIYHREPGGNWIQEDSHHSLPAFGGPNPRNITHDTQTDRVLISTDFFYWGGSGPRIPKRLRSFQSFDICAGRGHKNVFPEALIAAFISWLQGHQTRGYLAEPGDW